HPQHRRVPDAGGEDHAVADRARPRLHPRRAGHPRLQRVSAGAARFGVERRMPPAVRRAYEAPYDSWRNRISTVRFMQDIPLSPKDRAWPLLEASGRRLHEYAGRPAFIGWGLKDFVFDHHFLERFRAELL